MKSPTLAEIKTANPEFFSRGNSNFFGTYKWSKSGHIVSSPGKHGHTFRRWVNYETLKLVPILSRQINRRERWFIGITENETYYFQEIDCRGEFIGERLDNDQYQTLN